MWNKLYWHCCWICPTLIKNKLKTIPYLTRVEEMDRVELFEPTTSAMSQLSPGYSLPPSKGEAIEREKLFKPHPFHFRCSIAHTWSEVLRKLNWSFQFVPTIQSTSSSKFTLPWETAYCQTASVIEFHILFFTSSAYFANIALMGALVCWWPSCNSQVNQIQMLFERYQFWCLWILLR
jgi:hypothetical protein